MNGNVFFAASKHVRGVYLMDDNYAVLVGTPLDGVSVFGPFYSFEAAKSWCFGIQHYWISRMENPDE